MNSPSHYRLTTIACFVAIFAQAIVTNLTAILFIPLMSLYGFSYVQLGILVGINFAAQVSSDILFSGLIDKVGFRRLVLPAAALAFLGLVLFAFSPLLFHDVFAGIIVATIIFSMASGLLEVLLSPIVNAIPNNEKGPAMTLMHSFYAWGQVVTIIVTTLCLFIFGKTSWQVIAGAWAVVPLVSFVLFLKAPFPQNIPEEHRQNMRDLILKPFCLMAFAAIFAGAATEVVMNQWSSSFMEKALLLPKVTGDLLGMCGFAVMLGLGRTLYGTRGARLNLNKALVATSLLAVFCYLVVALSPWPWLSVAACAVTGFAASLLWPGTLVTASDRFPLAGAWLFALLAASGDIGAGFGPWLTGVVIDRLSASPFVHALAEFLHTSTDQAAIRTGILAAVVFPLAAFAIHIALLRMQKRHKTN